MHKLESARTAFRAKMLNDHQIQDQTIYYDLHAPHTTQGHSDAKKRRCSQIKATQKTHFENGPASARLCPIPSQPSPLTCSGRWVAGWRLRLSPPPTHLQREVGSRVAAPLMATSRLRTSSSSAGVTRSVLLRISRSASATCLRRPVTRSAAGGTAGGASRTAGAADRWRRMRRQRTDQRVERLTKATPRFSVVKDALKLPSYPAAPDSM